jgi:predicted CoA-substrate-specific enzyme activase
MIVTAGLDVGSTYVKAVILGDGRQVLGKALSRSGFKLAEMSRRMYDAALADAGLSPDDVSYIMSTGYGRGQCAFRDLQVTDLTASARGAVFLFPRTRTVLDVGGQTMKASRIDDRHRVRSFRLNDKCAAGTGAFLEKTARYMGYATEEIGALAATSHEPVPISGVCAVFAESEVINQLSQGTSAADIMQGSIVSLVSRSVQLLRRVQPEQEFTIIGGILRFPSMVRLMNETLGAVNVPSEDLVQFVPALGAAILGFQRVTAAQPEAAMAHDVEHVQSD